jgi:hypothetical protein
MAAVGKNSVVGSIPVLIKVKVKATSTGRNKSMILFGIEPGVFPA